MVLNPLTEEE